MKNFFQFFFFFCEHTPVNVELVKMRTIFELTGGRDSSEPRNMESIVRSSIMLDCEAPARELVTLCCRRNPINICAKLGPRNCT